MKITSLSLPLTMALLAGAGFSIATRSQEAPVPQPKPEIPAPQHPRSFPAPTNLQVLPKNLTGQQVHEIMHSWEAALGGSCGTCHTANPNDIGPNGRPRLNFADDSKPEKATARLMYRMTEEINTNYVAKVQNSGVPVTCGTCHRGHLGPEPFVAPPEHEHHDHEAAPAGQNPNH